jgi:hypothetical protein
VRLCKRCHFLLRLENSPPLTNKYPCFATPSSLACCRSYESGKFRHAQPSHQVWKSTWYDADFVCLLNTSVVSATEYDGMFWLPRGLIGAKAPAGAPGGGRAPASSACMQVPSRMHKLNSRKCLKNARNSYFQEERVKRHVSLMLPQVLLASSPTTFPGNGEKAIVCEQKLTKEHHLVHTSLSSTS